MIPDYPTKRLWQRTADGQRVGVEVLAVGPGECNVVIDVYEEHHDTFVGFTFVEFTLDEWDEIVKAVSEKRLDILKRLAPPQPPSSPAAQ